MKVACLLIFSTFFRFDASSDAKVTSSTAQPADRILIEKGIRKLTLYRGEMAMRSYRVALSGKSTGKKECQGDQRTPEGRYVIDGRNKNSPYHWSLRVSYPNSADRERARQLGCKPGGDIMIHGLPNGFASIGKFHTDHDWTLGCIAVTNQEIEEIWNLVPNGTLVIIKP